MQTMRFSEKQDPVNVYNVEPDRMDVVICLNERQVTEKEEETGKETTVYEYDGNIFRTSELTEAEIRENPEKYMDYPGDELPTAEMSEYANKMIDAYTEQLINDGII